MPELTVGDVAARSGAAVSALHFYERKGLIQSARTRGNQRRYGREVLRRIAVIQAARELGIPLAEVAAVLARYPIAVRPRAPTGSGYRANGRSISTTA